MSLDLGTIILNVFTTFFSTLLGTLLSPIDILLNEIDISIESAPLISNFYTVINTYFIPSISWFTNLVPPITWSAVKLHLDFTILIYSVVLIIHAVLKPLKIIKKLPLA